MSTGEGGTVLGKSLKIRGDISGSEDFFLDGTLDGNIALATGRVTIGPNATVHGEIRGGDVIVLGHHEGVVTATGKVEVRQSGMLLGDVTAASISIEDSAIIRGKVLLTGREV